MSRKRKEGGIRIRGFYRINLEENGKIVGDSGWNENTVVNTGYQDFLSALLGNTTGSKQIGFMGIGTGTAPNATHTSLDGELDDSSNIREAVAVSVSQSTKVRFTATFGSAKRTAAHNIRNVGLFDVLATTGGYGIFAGSTYASSTAATNQNVNATYDITFT